MHASAPPPSSAWTPGGAASPHLSDAVQWKLTLKSALLLGIGAAALFTITAPVIQMLSFLWLGVAGFLAARSYGRNVAHTAITPSMGMKLGALTGLFGALPIAIMTVASFAAIGAKPELSQSLQDQIRRQMPANADPKMQEMVQNMLAWVSTPQGEATMVLFLVLVFVVLSAAGGALGASFSGRRRQPH